MCGRYILVLVLLLGAAVTVAGNDADGSRSSGRLGGGLFSRLPHPGKRAENEATLDSDSLLKQKSRPGNLKAAGKEFDAALPPEAKSWFLVAKDVLSRIETPGITWDLKPERTHLKFRKVFYPLGITKLSIGADFNPMEASWRMHTSWRDQIVGGDLQLQGSEISVTKDFAVDDRTSLWLKAAWDWRTQKSMLGFKIKPGSGLSARLMKNDGPALNFRNQVPLGNNLSIELDGTLELPEAAYTTTVGGRVSLGLGDFRVGLNEVNVVCEV